MIFNLKASSSAFNFQDEEQTEADHPQATGAVEATNNEAVVAVDLDYVGLPQILATTPLQFRLSLTR